MQKFLSGLIWIHINFPCFSRDAVGHPVRIQRLNVMLANRILIEILEWILKWFHRNSKRDYRIFGSKLRGLIKKLKRRLNSSHYIFIWKKLHQIGIFYCYFACIAVSLSSRDHPTLLLSKSSYWRDSRFRRRLPESTGVLTRVVSSKNIWK